jgi:hypothetical protein
MTRYVNTLVDEQIRAQADLAIGRRFHNLPHMSIRLDYWGFRCSGF